MMLGRRRYGISKKCCFPLKYTLFPNRLYIRYSTCANDCPWCTFLVNVSSSTLGLLLLLLALASMWVRSTQNFAIKYLHQRWGESSHLERSQLWIKGFYNFISFTKTLVQFQVKGNWKELSLCLIKRETPFHIPAVAGFLWKWSKENYTYI